MGLRRMQRVEGRAGRDGRPSALSLRGEGLGQGMLGPGPGLRRQQLVCLTQALGTEREDG